MLPLPPAGPLVCGQGRGWPTVRLSTPRPWTAAGVRLRPPTVEHHGSGTGTLVLLHHGFMVDSNSVWHRSGLIERLAAASFDVVVITEHFVREAGAAHAFGHDVTLLLAEALADVLDGLGVLAASIIAAELVPPLPLSLPRMTTGSGA